MTLRLPVGVALTGEVAEKEIVASVFPRGLDRRQGGAEFAARFQALPHGGAVRFENVAAGAYVYRIQGDAGVSSEAMIVVPESATEVRLPDLVLPELSSLGVQIDPPVDGKGLPWELQLLPRATNRHTRRTVTSETDPTGWHSFPDVLAGDYFLFVEDSDGSLWVTEQLHIEDDRTLGLSLPGVAVEGRATLGEGPFIGELRFGGTHGSRKVTMATDEEGRFAGYLPEEGRWEVEISSEAMGCAPCDGAQGSLRIPPVEVTAGPSGKARLSIAIPNTRLAGRVFLEETTAAGETVRRLQPGATVFATRVSGTQEERGRQAQIWTDDGEFELLGLEPGVLRVGAMLADPPCESEWLEIEVEESSEAGSSIELVLRRKTHLVVQLVSETGPVGGATVFAVVPDGKSARGVSEADGSVSLEVPPGKIGTLFVDAAGHGLALEPFQVRREGAAPSPVLVPLVASSGSLVLSELPYEVFDQGSLISERGGVVPLRLIANLAPGKLSFGEAITISGLAPGGYRFCTRRGDCWEGVVFAGAPTELRLSEGK